MLLHAILPSLRLTGAVIAALVLLPATAFAEAVTYEGTLGKSRIILEISTPMETATESFAGRYAYMSQGIDIPLNAITVDSGVVELGEEKPCDETICTTGYDEEKPAAPIGARWTLATADDGATLTGTWRSEMDGKVLPIALNRYGTRELGDDIPATPAGLIDVVDRPAYGDKGALAQEASPYDYLKLQIKMDEGPETVIGESAFRYVTDPRTKFRFPRIVRLSAGGKADDAAVANAYLDDWHWRMNMAALQCAALRYQGFGWAGGSGQGSLGAYDEEWIEVNYLSPTVMSWSESGSLYCDSASPYNHSNAYTLDIGKGDLLDMSLLFKGWVARHYGEDEIIDLAAARQDRDEYNWGPDAALYDFIQAHRKSYPDYDAGYEEDCAINDSMTTNLAISFSQEGEAVFSLQSLPNYMGPCQGMVLYSAPMTQMRELLTPEAAEYFPALKGGE
jgi:hypothetical protein